MTLVELVARAIWPWIRYSIPAQFDFYGVQHSLMKWDQVKEGSFAHQSTMDAARAAVSSIREPDEDLLDNIGVPAFDRDEYHMSTYHCLGEAWKAMFDAAIEVSELR